MVIFAETKGKKDDQYEDKGSWKFTAEFKAKVAMEALQKKAVAMSKEERKSMVSKEGLCGAAERQRHCHQHGQPWPCLGGFTKASDTRHPQAAISIKKKLLDQKDKNTIE